MSWFFASGGQSIGVSASASVLPLNIQFIKLLLWGQWALVKSKLLLMLYVRLQTEDTDIKDNYLARVSKPFVSVGRRIVELSGWEESLQVVKLSQASKSGKDWNKQGEWK